MKNESGWFRLPGWWHELREHPGWQEKHRLGPVHWDVRRFGEVLAEEVPAHKLDAKLDEIYRTL